MIVPPWLKIFFRLTKFSLAKTFHLLLGVASQSSCQATRDIKVRRIVKTISYQNFIVAVPKDEFIANRQLEEITVHGLSGQYQIMRLLW
jgi:hypothetical protein